MSADDLDAIERRVAAASPRRWGSFVEDGDGLSGDDFCIGGLNDDEADMHVMRDAARPQAPISTSSPTPVRNTPLARCLP